MDENNPTQTEIRRLHRLLRQIARLAEHASMTGSLSDGARSAVKQYNAVCQRLERLGISPGELFPPLNEEETSFDELGVASALLASYLEEEIENPTPPPPPGGPVIVHSPKQGKDDLRELGELIREHLPELLALKSQLQAGADTVSAAQRLAEAEAERSRLEARLADLESRLAAQQAR
jgi:hypothetical protein